MEHDQNSYKKVVFSQFLKFIVSYRVKYILIKLNNAHTRERETVSWGLWTPTLTKPQIRLKLTINNCRPYEYFHRCRNRTRDLCVMEAVYNFNTLCYAIKILSTDGDGAVMF